MNEQQKNGLKLMLIKAFSIVFGVPLIVAVLILGSTLTEIPNLISFLFSRLF